MHSGESHSICIHTNGFDVDLTQEPGRHAHGKVRFSDPRTHRGYSQVEAGLLQTFGNWATFSALVRSSEGGDVNTVRITLDGAHPVLTPMSTTVTIVADGVELMSLGLEERQYRVR